MTPIVCFWAKIIKGENPPVSATLGHSDWSVCVCVYALSLYAWGKIFAQVYRGAKKKRSIILIANENYYFYYKHYRPPRGSQHSTLQLQKRPPRENIIVKTG